MSGHDGKDAALESLVATFVGDTMATNGLLGVGKIIASNGASGPTKLLVGCTSTGE